MSLALATDSAWPYDFTRRPAGTQVIMGYVGRFGYTPHVWTPQEVGAARAAGCQWWPIVTGISRGATNGSDGLANAAAMLAALGPYGIDRQSPMFVDLEPGSLGADLAGAEAMKSAFVNTLHANGCPHAYLYSTASGITDWMADWTNVRPATLPPNLVGWQYGGNVSPPSFDLSVFDSTLLTFLAPEDILTQPAIDAINAHTDAKINEAFAGLGHTLLDQNREIQAMITPAQTAITNAINTAVTTLSGKIAAGGSGGTGVPVDPNAIAAAVVTQLKAAGIGGTVDPDTIAAAVASKLPANLGQQVATAFIQALTAGLPPTPGA